MRRVHLLAVAVVLVGAVGEASAEWPHLQARSVPLGPPVPVVTSRGPYLHDSFL